MSLGDGVNYYYHLLLRGGGGVIDCPRWKEVGWKQDHCRRRPRSSFNFVVETESGKCILGAGGRIRKGARALIITFQGAFSPQNATPIFCLFCLHDKPNNTTNSTTVNAARRPKRHVGNCHRSSQGGEYGTVTNGFFVGKIQSCGQYGWKLILCS